MCQPGTSPARYFVSVSGGLFAKVEAYGWALGPYLLAYTGRANLSVVKGDSKEIGVHNFLFGNGAVGRCKTLLFSACGLKDSGLFQLKGPGAILAPINNLTINNKVGRKDLGNIRFL